ncbi:DUF3017 domain-containing protein [Nostocoides vanveenii]|jgi:hypothetical protein|uniref:DUF3017 domain-containing protein n=1 Tax=Nostocoides vanveenii TaxID=330835 RepID=A0ABP4XEP4_9MICO
MSDDQPWGPGRSRPVAPEPRPPAVARLGAWWVVAAILASGIGWAVTDHMLRATVSVAAACALGGVLRLVLQPTRAGGLVVRGKAVDVTLLWVFAAVVLLAGFALDLRARV